MIPTEPMRISYWNIESVWVFYLIVVICLSIWGIGVRFHVKAWLKALKIQAAPESRCLLSTVMEILTAKRIFKSEVSAGIMHTFIMWGFILLFTATCLIAVDYWVIHFLRGRYYLVFSFVTDAAGIFLIAGVLWALIRRYVQQIPRLEHGKSDWVIPFWILTAAVTGFLTQAARTAAQKTHSLEWSFAGNILSQAWTDPESAQAAHVLFWWLHAIISLGLIAFIPYSKLFHSIAAPISIYLKDQPIQIKPVEYRKPESGIFSVHDAIFLDACTRCGRCVEVCPASAANESFAPRDFIFWAVKSLTDADNPLNNLPAVLSFLKSDRPAFNINDIWRCASCRACVEVCPVYAAIPDAIRKQRSAMIEAGADVPELLSQTLKKIHKYDNPWESSKKKRDHWASDLDVPDITSVNVQQMEAQKGFCYFVGCTTSMETRAVSIARSFARILQHTGVPFATFGKKEPCCGDIARRVGEDGLFELKMESCSDLFKEYGIHQVVTSSPHCFNSFKNDYPAYREFRSPEDRIPFQVRHYTQVLESLVVEKKLLFHDRLNLIVTYHDPCFLGRYNRIFDAPRKVIRSIPGIKLIEMDHSRETSFCCGGGGGRMWQEDLDKGTKISEIRIKEAADTGAQVIITACPLCLIMLEDARKTAGFEDRLKIMDLNEVVAQALRI